MSQSHHHNSRGSKKSRPSHSLETYRVNTLTELCRIERLAAAGQFLTELRGLSRNYPFYAELVSEARRRILTDPESNRSWNLAWLCLTKMQEDDLIRFYASSESWRKEMWQDRSPTEEKADQLA
ncbi:uncharacterized protein PG986_011649 [Apiospora aurea]|uniref:Uncharacterized protein n=1 Tax=Apiospora aurea TaxID=335848 RepID=A0ABR1PXT3_9PEZI